MIDCYEIDGKYLDFLRNFDSRVPRSDYTTHDKFFCGVVLVIDNNISYYAPVSHFNTPQQTNIPIYDKGSKNMIPVLPQVITRVDVKTLYNTDPKKLEGVFRTYNVS